MNQRGGSKYCSLTGEPHCKCLQREESINAIYAKETLRKLFTDHAVYTKMVIAATLDNRPEREALTQRLLENQQEIGEFFGDFVGVEYGKIITNLLTKHIQLAAVVLEKMTKNEDPKVAIEKLLGNAEDVADALVSIPRNRLSLETVLREFIQHNLFVVDIAKTHAEKAWEDEIIIFDAYYTHMLKFSDLLYRGLLE